MSRVKIITADEAALLVKDGMTLTPSGFLGSDLPEALNKALEKRFLETGSPKDLTIFFPTSEGDRNGKGPDHFAHEGMVKRVIAGHWNMIPQLGQMVLDNKIEGYDFPQGTLLHVIRDTAAHKPGTITHVGLNTFVDPRIEGGKLNSISKENYVELINIHGEEKLFYNAIRSDIAFIRGTYADENGNISMAHEIGSLEVTSIAQSVKNNGGKVIVQVERLVGNGTFHPQMVKIPGIYVDAIVLSQREDHEQCVGFHYDGAICGEYRSPQGSIKFPPLSERKIIARRAAMELEKDIVVNLGVGVPEMISLVAAEEGIGDYMTLTVEAGAIGGVPQGGMRFGGSLNAEAVIDQPYQFDFYDGGGLQQAYLGLAEADEEGNINVSKFGPRIAGCGGFINITQNAGKVFFCGTFTAGGLKIRTGDGTLGIVQEGRNRKFLKKVEQITFSGKNANKTHQPVLYITERAVFRLHEDGVYLEEVAPGIDIENDILAHMDFIPKMKDEIHQMDERLFKDEPMKLNKKASRSNWVINVRDLKKKLGI